MKPEATAARYRPLPQTRSPALLTKGGPWWLELAALKTGENLELTAWGKNSLTLKKVVIGDHWVCSGQSNMEMDLGGCLGATEDIKAAHFPKTRRIRINHEQAGQPNREAPTATSWQVCRW
jgi:sialate O-acetylesterase